MADRVGERFGDYRLVRFLGRGGFGEVYLGEHIQDKSLAAVKVLKTDLKDKADLTELVNKLKEFINEASSFNLKHPNIVQLLAFGLGKGDTPFLAFEYAPNGSILTRHPRGISLPLATIVTYIKSIAAALQYAHDHRRIHRDVKPENILLGANNEVLLSDFGIATFAHGPESWEEQRGSGTLAYMAPEQIQRKAQPASDQYALGIMVYEWLSGRPPFVSDGVSPRDMQQMQVMYQHLEIPPPPLCKQVAAISPDVEQVVLTALGKDPKARFANIQAFASALEQTSQVTTHPIPRQSPTQSDAVKVPRTLPADESMRRPPVSPPAPSPLVDFPMFGYDLQHTRCNPHERQLSPANVARLILAWAAFTGGPISYSSPAVANGLVYIGSGDSKLYAFEATTGQLRWLASTEGYIFSSPAVANGMVYVGSEDKKLYAFRLG